MYCKKCGRELSANVNFCAGCGEKVVTDSGNKLKINRISKMMKLSILVSVMGVMLIGVIGCVLLLRVEKVNVVGTYYNGLIMLQCGDKYGLMDYDGNIVEPCIYDEIRGLRDVPQGRIGEEWTQLNEVKEKNVYDYIYNSIGVIRPDEGEGISQIGKDRYVVYTEKDNRIKRIIDTDKTVLKDLLDKEYYYAGLLPISDEECFLKVMNNAGYRGLLNKDGEIIINLEYEWIEYEGENLFVARKLTENGSKYGGIDINGNEIIPFEYDQLSNGEGNIISASIYMPEGYYYAGEDEWGQVYEYWKGGWKAGYINKDGEEVIPFEYELAYPFSEGLAVVGIDDGDAGLRRGYINTKGEEVIPFEYEDAWSFSEGLAAVQNGKYGYINTKGETVIPFEYEDARPFSEGLAVAAKKDANGDIKYGYINTKGEEVIPFEYEETWSFSEGLAAVVKEENGKMVYGYINTEGEVIVPIKYDYTKLTYPFSNGMAPVTSEDIRYGCVSKEGNELIPPICDYINDFKWGVTLEVTLEDEDTSICGIHPLMNIDDTTIDIGELRLAEIDVDGNYKGIFNSKKELIVKIDNNLANCAKYYKEAVNNYKKGKNKEAIKALEKAILLQPDNGYLKDLQNSIHGNNYVKNKDIKEDKVFGNKLPSLWFDSLEVRILEYVDEESMIVKFSLGNYIFQMKLPRIFEEEPYYICDYEMDSTSVSISLVNEAGDRGFLLTYSEGENVVAEYENWRAKLDVQNTHQVETVQGMKAVITHEDEWFDVNLLDGYLIGACDKENNIAMLCGVLSNNDEENEITKEYLTELAYKLKEDSDYLYLKEDVTDEYLQRMNSMYEKYAEIIEDATGYLKNDYMMVGEEYTQYYLVDLTADEIPEIVFIGRPNWIAIVGEKNAISLNGSSIIWTNVPGEFYTCVAFSFTEEWSRYKISVDKEGIMSVDCIQGEYLSSNGEEYQYEGKTITEEEYKKIFSELNHPYVYKATIHNSSGKVSEKDFYRKVQRLSNDFVYIP